MVTGPSLALVPMELADQGVFHLVVGSLGLGLAAGLAWILLATWRRQPVTSYRMAVAVLAGTLALPAAQFLVQRFSLLESTSLTRELAAHLPDWARRAPAAHEHGVHPEPASLAGRESTVTYHVLLAPSPTETGAERVGAPGSDGLDPSAEGAFAWVPDELPSARGRLALAARLEAAPVDEGATAPAITAVPPGPREGRGFPWTGSLLAAYGVGLFALLLRTALRVRTTRRLLVHSVPVTDANTLEVWRDVLAGSPLAGRVELRASHDIHVPMCFGLRHPTVILPASGEPPLSAEGLGCVLLHELVHLERRDTWVMLGQELARALFWFHPAAWWLCKRIDSLRELSCDHLVVDRTGRRRRYATALVEYAEWMRDGLGPSRATPAAALLPWTTSKSQLTRRIEMLVALSGDKTQSTRRPLVFAAGTLLLTLWGGQLAVAAAMSAEPGQELDDRCEACRDRDRRRAKVVELEELVDRSHSEIEVPAEVQVLLRELHEGDGPGADVLVEAIVQDAEGPEGHRVLFIDSDGEAQALTGGVDLWTSANGQEGGGPRALFVDEDGNVTSIGGGEGYAWTTEAEDPSGQTYAYTTRTPGRANRFVEDEPRMIGVRITQSDGDGERILIEEVLDDSIAETSGLRDRDVIVEIDGHGATLERLQKAKHKLGKQSIVLKVEREGEGVVVVEVEDDEPNLFQVEGNRFLPGKIDLKGISGRAQVLDLKDLQGTGVLELRGKTLPKIATRLKVLGDGDHEVYVIDGKGKVKSKSWSFGTSDDGEAEFDFEVLDGDDDSQWLKAKKLYGKALKAKAKSKSEEVKAKELYGKALKAKVDAKAGGDAQRALVRAKVLLEGADGRSPFVIELDGDDQGDAVKALKYRLKKEEGNPAEARSDTHERIEALRRELDRRAAELKALREELEDLRRSRGVSFQLAPSQGRDDLGVAATLSPGLAVGSAR